MVRVHRSLPVAMIVCLTLGTAESAGSRSAFPKVNSRTPNNSEQLAAATLFVLATVYLKVPVIT